MWVIVVLTKNAWDSGGWGANNNTAKTLKLCDTAQRKATHGLELNYKLLNTSNTRHLKNLTSSKIDRISCKNSLIACLPMCASMKNTKKRDHQFSYNGSQGRMQNLVWGPNPGLMSMRSLPGVCSLYGPRGQADEWVECRVHHHHNSSNKNNSNDNNNNNPGPVGCSMLNKGPYQHRGRAAMLRVGEGSMSMTTTTATVTMTKQAITQDPPLSVSCQNKKEDASYKAW